MKILVPLDGSRFAEAVLEPLVRLLASSDAELHLITVIKGSEARPTFTDTPSTEPHLSTERAMPSALGGTVPGSGARVPAETRTQAQERLRQEAADYLGHVSERFFAGDARREVIWGEDAAQAIIDYAGKLKVDVIAIATHGRTGLARTLMGSVAGTLLQAQVTPLFVIRPTGLNE